MASILSLWAVAILARASIAPRAFAWRLTLPAFYGFVVLTLLQSALLFPLAIWAPRSYPKAQALLFPFVTTLQVAAAAEAFWLLASALPLFRKPGVLIMVGCVAIAWFVAPVAGGTLTQAERTAGLALAMFILSALLVHGVIGTESKTAMIHASCLAVLSLSSFAHRIPALGAFWGTVLMVSMQIGQAVWWYRSVTALPKWKSPDPKIEGPTVEESLAELREIHDRVRSAVSGR